MKLRKLFAACLVCGIALTLNAQTAVAPPPKPADSGPSLAVTMQFIQDKLNQQGKINFADYVHDNAAGKDWVTQNAYEIGEVVIHPESCIISYNVKTWVNGAAGVGGDGYIPFNDVQDVVILPVEQAWKEIDSKAGNTTRSYKSDPPVFSLRVRWKVDYNEFHFTDEDTANRVAKAMVHAVELCGGGNKDPF